MIEVIDAHLVTAGVSIAIGVAVTAGYVGVAKLVAVVHIRAAMIVVVFAGAFDAVVESTPGNFIQLRRGSVPAALLYKADRHRRTAGERAGGAGAGCDQTSAGQHGSHTNSYPCFHGLSYRNFQMDVQTDLVNFTLADETIPYTRKR
jgi:hypothetical protein